MQDDEIVPAGEDDRIRRGDEAGGGKRQRARFVVAAGVALVVAVTLAVVVLRSSGDTGSVPRATTPRQIGGLTTDVPSGWHWSPPDGSAFNLWVGANYPSETDGCDQDADRIFVNLVVDPLVPNQVAQDPLPMPHHVGSSTAEIRTGEEWMDCGMRFQTFDIEIAGQPYRVSLSYGREADARRLAEAYTMVERLRTP